MHNPAIIQASDGAWWEWTPTGPRRFDPTAASVCFDIERLAAAWLRHDGEGRYRLFRHEDSGCRPRGCKRGFHCSISAPHLFRDSRVRALVSAEPVWLRFAEDLLAARDRAGHPGQAALIRIDEITATLIKGTLRGWTPRPPGFDTVSPFQPQQLPLPGID